MKAMPRICMECGAVYGCIRQLPTKNITKDCLDCKSQRCPPKGELGSHGLCEKDEAIILGYEKRRHK